MCVYVGVCVRVCMCIALTLPLLVIFRTYLDEYDIIRLVKKLFFFQILKFLQLRIVSRT
jgi:hypothetical protein